MAENTITGLVPDIYEALDIVSRELVGMVPAVSINASAATAAVGQNIRVDVEPEGNLSDIVPSMTIPEPTGQTSGFVDIVITNSKAAEFGFVGEAQLGLNSGPGYPNVRAQKIAQAIRKITNAVEIDLTGLHATMSRASGTAGTTPFASVNDFTAATFARKILKDNGGDIDPQLVINTAAGATMLGKQSAVDAAGTDTLLRQGVLQDISGMPLRESAQILTPAIGDSDGAFTTTAAGFAVGVTSIPLITGANEIVAGDVVTFAGDANQYVVTTGIDGPGTIVLAAPGLRQAIPASTTAVSSVAIAARNMCFARSALVLAARAPARPTEGDMADDVILITDPRSGLTMEFAMYKGYRKVRYEVALAWGVKNIKPEHTALLLG
tara:strand:- start:2773 stop:3915 length:1143 start_codon:yes stop_codon:yes gene_type:complete